MIPDGQRSSTQQSYLPTDHGRDALLLERLGACILAVLAETTVEAEPVAHQSTRSERWSVARNIKTWQVAMSQVHEYWPRPARRIRRFGRTGTLGTNTISIMESTHLIVDGVRLYALVRPGTPTILFLHGLAGYGGEWKPVCGLLDDSLGFVAPDQRGHGQSQIGPEVAVDRLAYVGDAVTIINQLVGGPVILVGQSMGGLVATYLAASRPDLVNHLVLIEAGVRPLRQTDIESLESWLDRWPTRFADDCEATRFFGHRNPSTSAWVDGLARTPKGLVRRFDPETLLTAMRALASNSRAEAWREISVPTTLVRAGNSAIGDDDIEEMVIARPDTRVVEILDSGHDVHLDNPREVATLLSDIAERHAQSPSE